MNRPGKIQPTVLNSLKTFFFEEQVPFGAALTRIFLPLMALTPMLMRFPRVRELYSTDGTPVQLFELFGQGEVLPLLAPGLAIVLYSVMVFCLLCSSIGWNTRFSLMAGVTLYTYFNLLDSVGTMTKYSVIAAHLMLLLSVSSCGHVWSVDEYLRRRRNPNSTFAYRAAPVWPARLMQLLFAFIYFGAAITKIQTAAFFSGEQMRYWMLSNWNYENPIGELMAMWSPLLLISAYVTCVWEILFGFLVWHKRARFVMLGVGATFHIMTCITLGLYVFPSICLSGYLCFVRPEDVIAVRSWFRRRSFSLPLQRLALPHPPRWMPTAAAWSIAALLFAAACVEVELQLDIFGTRRQEGLMQLTEIDPEVARERIHSEQPLREKDKVFSFHLGTTSIGGQVANRRTEFEHGEMLLAECNLNPPHEDMWVECSLEDDQQHQIGSFGQCVTREMLRAHFTYNIDERIAPGSYFLVLHSAGEEIARRPFTVTGEAPAVAITPGVYSN